MSKKSEIRKARMMGDDGASSLASYTLNIAQFEKIENCSCCGYSLDMCVCVGEWEVPNEWDHGMSVHRTPIPVHMVVDIDYRYQRDK